MRLLIITQKIDSEDAVLGFMHEWVRAFSLHVEHVYVICLAEGRHSLPANVTVLSLGKERGTSKLKYLKNFFSYIWRYRFKYDSVFVHMNHEYVLLGGFLWRLMGKKIGLWYAHGHVSFTLRLALLFTHHVFTSTLSGFRIASKKVHVVGQGIDTSAFGLPKISRSGDLSAVYVGRLSPVKGVELIIETIAFLKDKGVMIPLLIVGGTAIANQRAYADRLHELVVEKNVTELVTFMGEIPNHALPKLLWKHSLFINSSRTGSLDKAGVEAMATGMLLLTCNEAFFADLEMYKDTLIFSPTVSDLSEKIIRIREMGVAQREKIGHDLRRVVEMRHSLNSFTPKILSHYE